MSIDSAPSIEAFANHYYSNLSKNPIEKYIAKPLREFVEKQKDSMVESAAFVAVSFVPFLNTAITKSFVVKYLLDEPEEKTHDHVYSSYLGNIVAISSIALAAILRIVGAMNFGLLGAGFGLTLAGTSLFNIIDLQIISNCGTPSKTDS